MRPFKSSICRSMFSTPSLSSRMPLSTAVTPSLAALSNALLTFMTWEEAVRMVVLAHRRMPYILVNDDCHPIPGQELQQDFQIGLRESHTSEYCSFATEQSLESIEIVQGIRWARSQATPQFLFNNICSLFKQGKHDVLSLDPRP